jgi:hypothetical protein
MNEKFGDTVAEKLAKEKLECRNILAEINRFGISERQRLFLIYLLSVELEDPVACQDLSIVSRTLCSSHDGMISDMNA